MLAFFLSILMCVYLLTEKNSFQIHPSMRAKFIFAIAFGYSIVFLTTSSVAHLSKKIVLEASIYSNG